MAEFRTVHYRIVSIIIIICLLFTGFDLSLYADGNNNESGGSNQSSDSVGDDYSNTLNEWNVEAVWSQTKDQSYICNATEGKTMGIKLTFSYFLNNANRNYDANEVAFTVKGIDQIKRGGKIKAETTSTQLSSDWNLQYDATTDEYTFTYKNEIPINQSVSGGFQMQWTFNTRDAIDGYTYTSNPTFSTNDGKIKMPPLHFEYYSERDIYEVQLDYGQLTGGEMEELEYSRTDAPRDVECDENNELCKYTWYKYNTTFLKQIKARGIYRSDYFVAVSVQNNPQVDERKQINLDSNPSTPYDIVAYDLNYNPIDMTWIEDPATGEMVYGFYKFANRNGDIDTIDTFENNFAKDFILGVASDKVNYNTIVVDTRLIPLFNDEKQKIIDESILNYAGTLTAHKECNLTPYGFIYGSMNWWHSKEKISHKGENLINNFYEGQTVNFRLRGCVTKEYSPSSPSLMKTFALKANIQSLANNTLEVSSPEDGEKFQFIQGDDYLFVELNSGGMRQLQEDEYSYKSVHVITDSSKYDYDVYVSYERNAAFDKYTICESGNTGVNKTIMLPANEQGQFPKGVYVDIKDVYRTYKPVVDIGVNIKFDWEKEKVKSEEEQIKAENGRIINVSYMRLVKNDNVNFAVTSEAHYSGFFKDFIMPNDVEIYKEYLYRNDETVYLKCPTTNLYSGTEFSEFNEQENKSKYVSTITTKGKIDADENGELKKFSVYTKIPSGLFLDDLSNIVLSGSGVGPVPVDEDGEAIGTAKKFDSSDFKSRVSFSQFTDDAGNRYIAANFDFSDDPIEIKTGAEVSVKYNVYITATELSKITRAEYIADSYTMIHDQGVQKIVAQNQVKDTPDLNRNNDKTEIAAHSYAKSILNVLLKEWKEDSEKSVQSYYSTGYEYAADEDKAVRVDLKNGEMDQSGKANYSYRLDFTIGANIIKDIVMYDTIEPFQMVVDYVDKADVTLKSEWRGNLLNVDTSGLTKMGLENISVYYIREQLDIGSEQFKNSNPLGNANLNWIKMDDVDDIWTPHADDSVGTIAIQIDPEQVYSDLNSLASVVVNMEAPVLNNTTEGYINKYAQNYFTTVCQQRMQNEDDFRISEYKSAITHIVLKETKPTLKIKKIDKKTLAGLEGAKFTLYKDNECTNPVEGFENVVTDIFGEYEGELPYTGTFYLKEIEAPLGYEISPVCTVTANNSTNEVIVENERKKGIVEFHKKDMDDSSITDIAGAKYELYTTSGTKVYTDANYVCTDDISSVNSVFTTTNNGFTISGLPWGNYYLKEIEAPQGYELNDKKIYFSLQKTNLESNESELKVITEQYDSELTASIEITKSDAFDPSNTLSGAWYNVQKKKIDENGTVIWETVRTDFSTNAVGELKVDGLKFGEYRFVEKIAPKGYELSATINPKSVVLDATTVGQTFSFTQSDTQKTGSARLEKLSDTDAPISGAVFDLYKINGVRDDLADRPSDDIDDTLYRSGIKTGTDGKTPVVDDLDWGEYYFVETKAVTGYLKSEVTYSPESFEITSDNVDIMQEIKATNYQNPGSVVLSKYSETDKNIPDKDLLTGAVFKLCDKEGNTLISNIKSGTYDFKTKSIIEDSEETPGRFKVINIPWGSYYFEETAAPDGYAIADKVRFTINGSNCLTLQELECYDPVMMCEIIIDKEIDEVIQQFGSPTFIFKVTDTADSNKQWIKTIQLDSDKKSDSLKFSVPAGSYKIEEISVSRYKINTADVVPYGTTINTYNKNEPDNTFTCTLSSNGNVPDKFEVKYCNKLEYFNKFSHVTGTTNIIPVAKKITGISVQYKNEFIPLDSEKEESTYQINKEEELILTLIYDDGTEENVDCSQFENLIHTDSVPEFIVSNGINNASDEVELAAQYTVDGKVYKTKFYVTVAPAKLVSTQRVIYNVDEDNRSYFVKDGKYPTANVVFYSEGNVLSGTYSKPTPAIGAFMFSHWADSDNHVFSSETEVIEYLNRHSEVTTLNLTAILKNGVKDFGYTGNVQTFVAPVAGYYKIEGWGAQGGTASKFQNAGSSDYKEDAEGGKGGYSYGTVYLTEGQTIYIAVGGAGKEVISKLSSGRESVEGGWNGGGQAISDGYRNHSGSGGGATHFALTSIGNGTLSAYKDNQNDVLLVAGGGGGSYISTLIHYWSFGGYGGGEAGGEAVVHHGRTSPLNNSGFIYVDGLTIPGGTQESQTGSNNMYAYGTFGQGTDAEYNITGVDSGAGGGWYGGAKLKKASGAGGMAGGGGSGHVNRDVLINGETIGGNNTFASPTGSDEYGHTGDGYARVTYMGDEPIIRTFEYTQKVQTYIASNSGYYKFEAWGASGGKSLGDNVSYDTMGKGAYTSGVVYLNTSDVIYVYVGGQGGDGLRGLRAEGGWNGGGGSDWDRQDDESGGGGGGSTDFRLSAAGDAQEWKEFNSLKSRIMVAAGGAGGAYKYCTGGSGGGLTGLTGKVGYSNALQISASEPGTQTSGFAFGYGQTYTHSSHNYVVGGGGGGYYGATTVECNVGSIVDSGSAGGSSYISGYSGCDAIAETSTENSIIHTHQANHYSGYVFSNGVMIDGDSEMPSYDGNGTITGNVGNGFAKITYLG